VEEKVKRRKYREKKRKNNFGLNEFIKKKKLINMKIPRSTSSSKNKSIFP